MKCKCGQAFCWLCGRAVDDSVFPAHFQWWNPSGCSNMQMNEATQPSLASRTFACLLTFCEFILLGPISFASTLAFSILCCCCVTVALQSIDHTPLPPLPSSLDQADVVSDTPVLEEGRPPTRVDPPGQGFFLSSLSWCWPRSTQLFSHCMSGWGMFWLFVLLGLPLGAAAFGVGIGVCIAIYPFYFVYRLSHRNYPWPDSLTRFCYRFSLWCCRSFSRNFCCCLQGNRPRQRQTEDTLIRFNDQSLPYPRRSSRHVPSSQFESNRGETFSFSYSQNAHLNQIINSTHNFTISPAKSNPIPLSIVPNLHESSSSFQIQTKLFLTGGFTISRPFSRFSQDPIIFAFRFDQKVSSDQDLCLYTVFQVGQLVYVSEGEDQGHSNDSTHILTNLELELEVEEMIVEEAINDNENDSRLVAHPSHPLLPSSPVAFILRFVFQSTFSPPSSLVSSSLSLSVDVSSLDRPQSSVSNLTTDKIYHTLEPSAETIWVDLQFLDGREETRIPLSSLRNAEEIFHFSSLPLPTNLEPLVESLSIPENDHALSFTEPLISSLPISQNPPSALSLTSNRNKTYFDSQSSLFRPQFRPAPARYSVQYKVGYTFPMFFPSHHHPNHDLVFLPKARPRRCHTSVCDSCGSHGNSVYCCDLCDFDLCLLCFRRDCLSRGSPLTPTTPPSEISGVKDDECLVPDPHLSREGLEDESVFFPSSSPSSSRKHNAPPLDAEPSSLSFSLSMALQLEAANMDIEEGGAESERERLELAQALQLSLMESLDRV